MYPVISEKLDSPPGNTKKQEINPIVADRSAISPSLGGYIYMYIYIYTCIYIHIHVYVYIYTLYTHLCIYRLFYYVFAMTHPYVPGGEAQDECRGMTPSFVWHVLFLCALTHPLVQHAGLVPMCDMPCLCVCHDSSTRTYMWKCGMTHPHVQRAHICETTCLCVCHHSSTHARRWSARQATDPISCALSKNTESSKSWRSKKLPGLRKWAESTRKERSVLQIVRGIMQRKVQGRSWGVGGRGKRKASWLTCVWLDVTYLCVCAWGESVMLLSGVVACTTYHQTLQHTATHCNTLQVVCATHCNTLQHTARTCPVVQSSGVVVCATRCNTLHWPQQTATHCNILHHTAYSVYKPVHTCMNAGTYMHACMHVCIRTYKLTNMPAKIHICTPAYIPPDPINYDNVCSLSVIQTSGNCFTYHSV